MCTNTYRTLHVIFVLRVTLSTANLEPNGLVYVSWFLEVRFANICVRYCLYVWIPWSFRRTSITSSARKRPSGETSVLP